MRDKHFSRRVLPVTTAVAAAFSLSACSGTVAQDDIADADVKVCRDSGGKRVPDSHCGQQWPGASTSHGAHFWYLAAGSKVPALGQSVAAGSAKPLPGKSYAMASEQNVRRAGFGSTARSTTVVAVRS